MCPIPASKKCGPMHAYEVVYYEYTQLATTQLQVPSSGFPPRFYQAEVPAAMGNAVSLCSVLAMHAHIRVNIDNLRVYL